MTFWATLWYAGSVVLTMGFEGQTMKQCEDLAEIMMLDITSAYDQNLPGLETSIFPTDKFYATCEKELLVIGEKYAE